ncbi:MAG TPA: Clp protease N-terminal domain-containing protein [Streptosporangiaceae bacterium]
MVDAVSTAQSAPAGRRWLRRHAEVSGEPEELRTTPAADTGLNEAVRLAGLSPVGSHHLLIAALSDRDTAAARALAAAGVDLDRAMEALRTAEVTGTSDELPEERGRRHMQIQLADDRLVIEVTDQAAVELGRAALKAVAGEAGAAGGDTTAISGELDVAVSLVKVWQALMDSLADISRRASGAQAAEAGQKEKKPGRARRRAREAGAGGGQDG